MRRLGSVLTLVMAAIWLLATFHCRLEAMPVFKFLSCCSHEEGGQPGSHHEQDCRTDSCASVEAGFYKKEECRDGFVKPALHLPGPALCAPEIYPPGEASDDNLRPPLPPPFSNSWVFDHRAAPLARAPSFAS